MKVTCLGLGGYHIGWTSETRAQATIEAALQEGIRFFDTAESYGPHTSEERYGKYLTPAPRDRIFLMTKSAARRSRNSSAKKQGSSVLSNRSLRSSGRIWSRGWPVSRATAGSSITRGRICANRRNRRSGERERHQGSGSCQFAPILKSRPARDSSQIPQFPRTSHSLALVATSASEW
ncbi:MAG: aldo/keto reductase [Verrucomicrobia bacterium]|nr:aldo/keto reductase [Verrucomicrobiota bacterium]